jgi:hypothetical protein
MNMPDRLKTLLATAFFLFITYPLFSQIRNVEISSEEGYSIQKMKIGNNEKEAQNIPLLSFKTGDELHYSSQE